MEWTENGSKDTLTVYEDDFNHLNMLTKHIRAVAEKLRSQDLKKTETVDETGISTKGLEIRTFLPHGYGVVLEKWSDSCFSAFLFKMKKVEATLKQNMAEMDETLLAELKVSLLYMIQ